jgi:putative FmdB family regulatory protein
MPIYEYSCRNCGERVEVLVRSSYTVPLCSHCGSPLLDKLFSIPYVMGQRSHNAGGGTCCGQEERCATPPCSTGGSCRRE